MLTVIAVNPTTVTISITHPRFAEDLQRLQNDVPAQQRTFHERKWTVTGADRLQIPYIQEALATLLHQGDMFTPRPFQVEA